ncbi:MAG: DNA-3-methyladenine glycosylase I [Rhodospirillales bacterium]|nr:MAG: DNA-3-methyladenine glycosylase I [Rhodospirillales bacterium]
MATSMHQDSKVRCGWVTGDLLYLAYHDAEWGVPEWDDRALFEKLMLDSFQAGLSWLTILRKREGFRRAFRGFEPERIARFGPDDVARLMADSGIVRNRAKIEATIAGARAWLELMAADGGFAPFIWRFVDGAPRRNRWPSLAAVPAATPESQAMAKALRARGFRFVGPTTCYAFMQAVGMVNDHVVTCFRHAELD